MKKDEDRQWFNGWSLILGGVVAIAVGVAVVATGGALAVAGLCVLGGAMVSTGVALTISSCENKKKSQ